MKRQVLLLLTLGILLLTGCNNGNSPVLSTAISQIDVKAKGHLQQLHEYDSPYTICYKNKDDTYSMYIFSSPIQYKTDTEYRIIDNTVIKSNKKGFAFENKANNIKTYFPITLSQPFRIEKENDYMEFKPDWNIEGFSQAEQTIFTNMYDDNVSAVLYESNDMNLIFYPTKAGIKLEVVLKKKPKYSNIVFTVKSSALTYENKQNGYIRLLKGNNGEETDINAGIIYNPLVKYTSGSKYNVDIQSKLNFFSVPNGYKLNILLNEAIFNGEDIVYPIRLDPSFELYQEKTPDSTVYSNLNVNNFLANFAVVGEHPVLGEGWHYSRMYVNKFLFIKSNNIISADFHIKDLYSYTKNSPILQMSSVDELWSSSEMIWNTKVQPYRRVISPVINNEYIFDTTNFVKEVVADTTGNIEIYGNVIQRMDALNGYSILATSDNSLYTPYIHLKFI